MLFILASLESQSASVFLLVINELFTLGVMVEALRANIDSKSAFFKRVGQFGPKFQVGSDIPHQPFVHR